jgi:hypothetical protein
MSNEKAVIDIDDYYQIRELIDKMKKRCGNDIKLKEDLIEIEVLFENGEQYTPFNEL